MRHWKFYCMEDRWPGLWRRALQNQVVPIGWPPDWGYRLRGRTKRANGWSRMRNAFAEMKPGDTVVVQLRGNKIGRIGEVIRLEVEDRQWRPLVPKSRQDRAGEMGRHVIVRWDLAGGPLDHDLAVELPQSARLSPGKRRAAVCELPPRAFRKMARAAADKRNWVPYSPHVFSEERSISDFLGTYPHHLEDGLQPYPSMKVREHVFGDHSRADVLLIDRRGRPVVVECKQSSPTVADLRQLRRYMSRARRVIGRRVRGLLVHGGSARLPSEVKRARSRRPRVDVVRYAVSVAFSPTD